MTTIFIDTGALIARYLESDQFHEMCLEQWHNIVHAGTGLVTTNHVLDETLTLLARRASYQFASEKAHLIYRSQSIRIFRPDLDDELKALNWFDKFSDQQVSFTDCLSFVVMKRYKIETAFTYDRHFAHAGFEMLGRS